MNMLRVLDKKFRLFYLLESHLENRYSEANKNLLRLFFIEQSKRKYCSIKLKAGTLIQMVCVDSIFLFIIAAFVKCSKIRTFDSSSL